MSLLRTIQAAVDTTFALLIKEGLARQVTYTMLGEPTFNTTTMTATEAETSFTLYCIWGAIQTKHWAALAARGAPTGDIEATFKASDFPSLPRTGNRLTGPDSELYEVRHVYHDPAQATYTMILVRMGD